MTAENETRPTGGEAPLQAMQVACSRGRRLVSVGDEFEDGGARGRVEEFVGHGMYSPSGLGGTPTIRCRHIAGKLPRLWEQFMKGEFGDWCGDSVAAHLMEKDGHVWQR